MPEYLAPGVFVEETSFRAKSIEGVSTTTTGFIGAARFGPVALEPEVLTSLGEYEQAYEPLDRGRPLQWQQEGGGSFEAPNFLWHAVRAFFNEGGRRLYVSRVFRPLSGDYAPIRAADEAVAAARNAADTLWVDGHARVDPATIGGLRVRARHPGAAGNLRVRFEFRAGPNVLAAATDPADGSAIATLRSAADLDLVWLSIPASPPDDGDRGALYLAHRGETDADWQLEPMAPNSPPDAWLAVRSLNASAEPGAGATVRPVTLGVILQRRDGGADGGRELARWTELPIDPRHRSGNRDDSVFARFANRPASTADARLLPLVIARVSSGSGAVNNAFDVMRLLFGADPTALLQPSSDEQSRGVTPADKLGQGVGASFPLDGGHDGLRPGADEVAGRADPRDDYALGLPQFEGLEDISMVAAPGATWHYADVRDDANAVTGLLIAHAERMRYRVALLDAAEGQTLSDVRNMRAKLDSKHAALYYPWVTVLDPITRRELQLPPSGFVAGICARNDIERGVWKAPANEVVRGAIGFENLLNRAQQEVLNPEGINCLRFFEGRGYRLWGARTISSDPEWKYLNVRRYFAYLERSIDKGTQWAVFEPNGDALWANVRRTIEDFLLNEWQSGALLGEKPDKAFFVRCDRSTMTQNDLDNGRLICLIGVAPLKPAEFVIFRIGQWTADRKA